MLNYILRAYVKCLTLVCCEMKIMTMVVLQQVLDDGTDPWGVQVERVEM